MSESKKISGHSGSLFMITAPSGAGKSSLVKALLAQDSSIKLSISYTTRDPRPGEMNGREYHFTTVEDFVAKKTRNEFLEWALVHGNYYGTSRIWIEEQLQQGHDVLLEIDWQGAQQVRKLFPDVLGIFVLPPSLQILSERLHGRGTDSQEVIAKRLLGAGAEIAHANEFEYVIVNDDFEQALDQLKNIISASRLTYKHQSVRLRQQFISLGVPL